MKKYLIEFIGTCFFVMGIFGALSGASVLAPLYIGLTLTTLVYMGGSISGAHYNPAVTFGLFVNKKIKLSDACCYVIAQFLGAVVAYAIVVKGLGIHSASPLHLVAGWKAIFIAEAVFTFALVSVVHFVAVNKSVAGNSYFGLAIGMILTVGILVGGKVSGGFFNPAVLLGVGLAGGISIKIACIIVLAQIIGATCAAGVYRYVVEK